MEQISAELFSRSVHLTLGPFDLCAERRSREWPRSLMWHREPGNAELWVGRWYLCVARQPTSPPSATKRQADIIPFRQCAAGIAEAVETPMLGPVPAVRIPLTAR